MHATHRRRASRARRRRLHRRRKPNAAVPDHPYPADLGSVHGLRSALVAPMTLAAIALIAASAPAVYAQASAPVIKLSDDTTSTRWANAAVTATVYSRPSRDVRAVGRLRLLTEDGYPEVYL